MWKVRILSIAVLALGLVCHAAEIELPVTIDDVEVDLKKQAYGDDKGTQYLQVSFKLKPHVKILEGTQLRINGQAGIEGETKADSSTLASELEELERGKKSKRLMVPLFIREGLSARPQQLDLTFTMTPPGAKEATGLGQFCWRGKEVEPGSCPAS